MIRVCQGSQTQRVRAHNCIYMEFQKRQIYAERQGPPFACGVCVSRSVMSNSLGPHGLQPTRLLYPQNYPGKNTGVGCHFLLQGTFLTQGSKQSLLHFGQRQVTDQECKQRTLSHNGSAVFFDSVPDTKILNICQNSSKRILKWVLFITGTLQCQLLSCV